MVNSYKIKLCLLTRNRPEFAFKALDSLISQTHKCDIYVSDNSTNDDFKAIYEKGYNNLENLIYIKRNPSLPGIDHFNLLIQESKEYDFVLFFHDDDILNDNYVSEIVKSGKLDDNKIVAIGTNSTIIRDDCDTKLPILFSKKNLIIENKKKLVDHYFNLEFNGAVPFPSYLYRVSTLSKIKISKEKGGKHSDFFLLLNLLEFGELYWLCKPLMKYRIHQNNDSRSVSIQDRESLYRHLHLNKLVTKNIERDFKLMLDRELLHSNQLNKIHFFISLLKYAFNNTLSLRIFKILYKRINRYKFY